MLEQPTPCHAHFQGGEGHADATAGSRRRGALMTSATTSLGHLWRDMGWLEEAVALHREALTLQPDEYVRVHSLVGLAEAFRDMGRLKEALAHAEAAAAAATRDRLRPDSIAAVFWVLAGVHEAIKRDEEAWVCMEEAVKQLKLSGGKPSCPELLIGLRVRARRLLRAGRLQEAEEVLRPSWLLQAHTERMEKGLLVTKGRSDFLRSLWMLAEAYGRQGKEEQAALLRADIAETEAIDEANRQALVEQLVMELRAERAGGSQSSKKKKG